MSWIWKFGVAICAAWGMGLALGQSVQSQLIDLDLGRTEGLFTASPVSIRALALNSARTPSSGTALLWFRGWPGVAQIKDADDWRLRNNLNFFSKSIDEVLDAGLTLVLMDCPSDQGGVSGGNPQRCNDTYRQSAQHAGDVRRVMAHLRDKHGISRFFIIGHSYGTVSSRWLAIHLGDDIQGSIHSATMTGNNHSPGGQHSTSIPRIDMGKVKTPYVYLHNEDDQCRSTSYSTVKSIAGERLITLKGGEPTGDVCGGRHYHSYAGIELQAARAVVKWVQEQSPPAR